MIAGRIFLVFLLSLLTSRAYAQPQYTLVDLGVMNNSDTTARAVNNSGRIAGFSIPQGSEKAFRTSPNATINSTTDGLGSLGGNYSQAHAMNDGGQVVGLASLNISNYHAFRTTGTGVITAGSDLGTLSGQNSSKSVALGINASGQVVGWSQISTGSSSPIHAFRTGPNQAIIPVTSDLGTLGGGYSEAKDINSSGEVTGYARLAGDATYHAFRTAPNAAINSVTSDLGTLGGPNSIGWALNDSSEVVGESQTLNEVGWRAFKTTAGGVITGISGLGTLGGMESHARDINASGKVVGYSDTVAGLRHAFIYDGTSMRDLNDLISAGSGWVLEEAWSINSNCQITGNGTLSGSALKHAFLLTPITGDCSLPDLCPQDPNKTSPGQCGCGVPDFDTDNDGTADCIDACPSDAGKIAPGQCGCGVPDSDDDGDGVADCHDLCPGTPVGRVVDANGCPLHVAADFDFDMDVDGDDFVHFRSCAAGEGITMAPPCTDADLDHDGDIDMNDFGIVQRCFSGAGVPADLHCSE